LLEVAQGSGITLAEAVKMSGAEFRVRMLAGEYDRMKDIIREFEKAN
tara:strand:+ start:928 stop:1068 length:141 start_codon:yes stop_codon:yes gene_type:complete